MTVPAPQNSSFNDLTQIKVAREIAMDLHPIEKILELHSISVGDWEVMQKSENFQSLLRLSVQEWNSAINTSERVKLKSMAFVEESLPEFYARAHDPKEGLAAKVEVLKTVARFAGVGANTDAGATGERLSVTINLGADKRVTFEKQISPQTIEGSYE